MRPSSWPASTGAWHGLPSRMPFAGERVYRRFADLLARFMPFDLVIDERTSWGNEARVSKTSVCGSFGAIAGTLRYFADRHGCTPRPSRARRSRSICCGGTRAEASRSSPMTRRRGSLVLEWTRGALGLRAGARGRGAPRVGTGAGRPARRVLAQAWREGRRDTRRCASTSAAIAEVRELWRRSGGRTGEARGAGAHGSLRGTARGRDHDGRVPERPLELDLDALVPPRCEQLLALPGVPVRDQEMRPGLRGGAGQGGDSPGGGPALPAGEARSTLVEEELPVLDRPLRFVVNRGRRGNLRATHCSNFRTCSTCLDAR